MTPLAEFLALREGVRAKPVGDGGVDTCTALTSALDRALIGLAGRVADEHVAIVAVGGYGRGEQCLWSDVDVMLLHDDADTNRLVREVLYPLWDANLRVGHSVRTVRECGAAARERFETLTALLSSRLVAGDAELVTRLEATLAKLISGRPLAPRLAAMERERRRADPYPVMTADLKNGRGGLRTFQGLGWERRRARLLGLLADPESAGEAEARRTLLAIRNGLHSAAGRAVDVFEFDLREPAARWLGTGTAELAHSLCAALYRGDRLAERHWPDLLVAPDPLAGIRRHVSRAVRSRFGAGEGNGGNGPLVVAARVATGSAAMAFEAVLDAGSPQAADRPWSGADRRAFLEIIGSGERGWVVFGWLDEVGWLARHFPEWRAVVALPEQAPFHEHPVDAHLWRTVDEMRALISRPEPLVAEILAELGSTEELLLAALLHDIGKGSGRDHAEAGADGAAAFLRRAGFGPATLADVVPAVRHHLLLGRVSTRSDMSDPDVIDAVADTVASLRTLQVLYLLAIADARATGRTMWTEWKATLLRELYIRVAARFGPPGMEAGAADPGGVAQRSGGRFSTSQVAEHLAAMTPGYVVATPPDDVLWHLEALAALDGPVGFAVDATGRRVVVVGADRRGFLLSVCRAFAASGIAVLDARLNTRGDGTVIDVFEVREDRGGGPVLPGRWPRFEQTLSDVLLGERDVRSTVAERAAAYPAQATAVVRVRALPPDSHRHTVVEIRAPDRIGLLAAIAEALHSEGLDVHLARIDTRAGEAIDTFHVRRLGVPIRSDSELAALTRRLEDRLRV